MCSSHFLEYLYSAYYLQRGLKLIESLPKEAQYEQYDLLLFKLQLQM